jgi:hypothetical protein
MRFLLFQNNVEISCNCPHQLYTNEIWISFWLNVRL